MVVTLGSGNIDLWATAQSDSYADLANFDLTRTCRNRSEQAIYEPDEGESAVRDSVHYKLASSDGNFDQSEPQPERRFLIQDDEAPTENEDQTNQPRTFFQVVTNFLKRAFGSCFKSIFGASKED